jgi:hypothetical protein
MKLDDLYKNNIGDSGQIPSGFGWDDFNPKLKRRLFFRFNPTKFNLYYLLLFISFSAFSSYSGYRGYILYKENHRIKQKEIIYKTPVDSLRQMSRDSAFLDTTEKGKSMQPVRIEKTKIKKLRKINNVFIQKTPAPVQSTQVKHIKKTVIVKPTVIEQNDTVKILN